MKIIIIAAFLFITGILYCTAQAPETMLDPSFGDTGKIILPDFIDSIPNYYDTYMNTLALQGNKILSATYSQIGVGTFKDSFYVARYSSDGSFDQTFGTNGVSSFKYPGDYKAHQITDMGCQSDGKILVNTYHWGNPNSLWGIARLNKNGSLDTTFGQQGFKRTSNYTYAMLVLPGDKIVTASLRNIKRAFFMDVRIFDKNGFFLKLTTIAFQQPLEPSSSIVVKLRLTHDKKIVLANSVHNKNKFEYGTALVRLKADGNLDSTFNNSGEKYTVIGGGYEYDGLGDLIIQEDNKIVVGLSTFGGRFKLMRLNVDGSTDENFGINGFAETAVFGQYAHVNALQIDKNKNILVFGGGSVKVHKEKFSLAIFKVNGHIDSTFGTNGQLQTDFYYLSKLRESDGVAMIIQPDNKIVCGGNTITPRKGGGTRSQACLARYLPEKLSNNIKAKTLIASSIKTNKPFLLRLIL